MELIKKIFSPIGAILKFFSEHFKGLLFVLILFLIFAPSSKENISHYNLQKIKLSGTILDVSEVLSQIQKATDDSHVKGVLFEVNSPGGAVAPSVELAYAIKKLKEQKPVVVYGSGVVASGSYYASIWADKIIVNPGSMVGSIGVIMQGANLSELMDKIGIKTQVVKAGKYKQVGTPDRAWKPYEIAELNKVIQDTYDMFTSDVANARKLDIKKRDMWANAHIFTARQAKDVGLIDMVGVESDAKEELVRLSGVTTPIWNKEDKFEKLFKKLSAQTATILYTYFPSISLR
ncbi:MAG: signal peptide peptidase SppA [Epsilonproteobacteria bacterium]|nr:signal peptide peptidase SppA [Campylobacterota bacterium]